VIEKHLAYIEEGEAAARGGAWIGSEQVGFPIPLVTISWSGASCRCCSGATLVAAFREFANQPSGHNLISAAVSLTPWCRLACASCCERQREEAGTRSSGLESRRFEALDPRLWPIAHRGARPRRTATLRGARHLVLTAVIISSFRKVLPDPGTTGLILRSRRRRNRFVRNHGGATAGALAAAILKDPKTKACRNSAASTAATARSTAADF